MRTHDSLYLKENRYEKTKESFKFCASFIDDAQGWSICDVGCAAGEFAFYLKRRFPEARISGLDVVPELIEKAKKEVIGVGFRVGSVNDTLAFPTDAFDASFMVGVHSIFEDPTVAFRNLITWTRRTVIVFGLFNPHPVDVYLTVRTMDQPPEHREAGWNMISQQTVANFLRTQPKVVGFDFHRFEIDIDLAPQQDPLRSWTERLGDGRRQIVSGIGLVHHFYALIIRLK